MIERENDKHTVIYNQKKRLKRVHFMTKLFPNSSMVVDTLQQLTITRYKTMIAGRDDLIVR